MQPALCVQHLLRPLVLVQVAHEQVAPPGADLPDSFLVGVVDLRFAAFKLLPPAARGGGGEKERCDVSISSPSNATALCTVDTRPGAMQYISVH